ncbi:TetR/AcrR family transcriptional regulator [Phycicoccus endophyticus]|uniref:TetR/AcrR family transcriptional regulator n=1 Tax=Phycicoccus endophyticus TaxID=1690220 RepID=A0A7G9R1M4_9MICO|nr:TetR/AcrR family transcriptional regulator [Phycicoccus endophyticus]NHI18712.1 TetR/AcrR family transcriptional regulator [Phycicoccus endophyticus]QNN49499.1 TetR/AcrR family transcriptional regulator [Phycicoccus endophyticus]GGL37041.1 hypothetical protein GCM10012283_19530 [Phycicoccus endophyticus]
MTPPPRTRKAVPEAAGAVGRRANRGPAAAAANRERLLLAARRLFASQGYRVPLSAVAREAGVGQGVLYRHFPTRLSLAVAAFEENIDELEQLADRDPGPGGFLALWGRTVETLLESTALVELVADAGEAEESRSAAERMAEVFAGPLERARAAGVVRPELTVEDVLLVVRMLHGLAVTGPTTSSLAAETHRALWLLDPALAAPLDGAAGGPRGASDGAVGTLPTVGRRGVSR